MSQKKKRHPIIRAYWREMQRQYRARKKAQQKAEERNKHD